MKTTWHYLTLCMALLLGSAVQGAATRVALVTSEHNPQTDQVLDTALALRFHTSGRSRVHKRIRGACCQVVRPGIGSRHADGIGTQSLSMDGLWG